MSEAAAIAELAALNARCAASPFEAANYAALLRRTPRAEKGVWLFSHTFDNHSTLVRLLLADGFSPNTVHPEHKDVTLLHEAAQRGSIDVLRLLLEAGANANSTDSIGNTPLVDTIQHGRLACASELIPHTDLRIFCSYGKNALHNSIMCNQPKIFKMLLPHFADDIDVRTIKGRAPADPDKPYNETPLLLACGVGHHAMVKALLAAGASRTTCNNESVSCLHFAAQRGHLACVTMLIGRPDNQKMSAAEIDARDEWGARRSSWLQ